MSQYFEIQYYSASAKIWCQSSSAPSMDGEVDEEAVWKAYVNYLGFAYPDVLYRLVRITIEKKVEPIHV